MEMFDALMVLSGCVIFAVLLSLYFSLRLVLSIGAIRRESRKGAELAKQIREEWGEHEGKQTAAMKEAANKVEQRMAEVQQRMEERLGGFEEQVTAVRNHLTQLEDYLRDFFEVEVKNAFDSFDNTVTDVLDQMKSELLRGVDRIEDIQTVVSGRTGVENRLTEGQAAVYRITDGETQPVPGTCSAMESGASEEARADGEDSEDPGDDAESPDSAEPEDPEATSAS